MKISVEDLLNELILVSEKSAQISRLCRIDNNELFDILIQEKTNETKNPRFLRDFKTFADVLIQEMAKNCLENKVCSAFSESIFLVVILLYFKVSRSFETSLRRRNEFV